jgi:hypothetical protein
VAGCRAGKGGRNGHCGSFLAVVTTKPARPLAVLTVQLTPSHRVSGVAMRSPNSERDCLPISGDAERPMSDARRNVAGRPEGQYERPQTRALHDRGDRTASADFGLGARWQKPCARALSRFLHWVFKELLQELHARNTAEPSNRAGGDVTEARHEPWRALSSSGLACSSSERLLVEDARHWL